MGILLKLLGHLGTLVAVAKDIEAIVADIKSGKEKFPSEAELMQLFDDLVSIVGSGVVPMDPVVQKSIVDALQNLKAGVQK